MKSKIILHK